jgi:hypothetical protein
MMTDKPPPSSSSSPSGSDPDGSDGAALPSAVDNSEHGNPEPPPAPDPRPEPDKGALWRDAVALLKAEGVAETTCRTFMGELVGTHRLPIVRKAIDEAMALSPAPADARDRYEAVQRGRPGFAVVVPVNGMTCGGCRTLLTADTVNQAMKGKEIVACDSCSRILYIDLSRTVRLPNGGARKAHPWRLVWPSKFRSESDETFARCRFSLAARPFQTRRVHLHSARPSRAGHRCR